MRHLFYRTSEDDSNNPRPLIQRRFGALNHMQPFRWNWEAIVRPLDRTLERGADAPVTAVTRIRLRFFWLHGVFNAISDSFMISFIPLFALAYGASNGEVGWLTALANLLGAVSLFPGARAIEKVGKRKPVVNWTFGGIGRFAVLVLALLPFFGFPPLASIVLIVAFNGLRTFMDNFANPAWTSMVADIVPLAMRGQYFSKRNMAMGVAALIGVPLAGWLIKTGNTSPNWPLMGYQVSFFIAFIVGMLSTYSFHRIPEPEMASKSEVKHQKGDLRRAIRLSPGFMGLVISAFIWNMSLQIAAPFFNVYLVNNLGASLTAVGIITGITSLSALVGQPLFGRMLDRRGALWVQTITGLLIPLLPLAWMIITEPWHVGIINLCSGFLWAGYNLSNFNLLLELSPDEQRPRAVALYQTAVFSSAVLGPLLGGYLADAVNFQLVFGLSGAGRFAGMLIFLVLAAFPAYKAGKGIKKQAEIANSEPTDL